jgi:hypothetical protein
MPANERFRSFSAAFTGSTLGASIFAQTLTGWAAPQETQVEYRCQPVQSIGNSIGSKELDNYLRTALASFSELASESPGQVRVMSSAEARNANMDPWAAKNRRRIRLIKLKHRGGLTAGQTAELARLKREIAAHVKHVAPRSSDRLEEFEDFVRKMRVRTQSKRGG